MRPCTCDRAAPGQLRHLAACDLCWLWHNHAGYRARWSVGEQLGDQVVAGEQVADQVAGVQVAGDAIASNAGVAAPIAGSPGPADQVVAGEQLADQVVAGDGSLAPAMSFVLCRHLGRRVRDQAGGVVQRPCPSGCRKGTLLDVFQCRVLGEVTLATCQTCPFHQPRPAHRGRG